jgi:dipeptidyl aminopeptidase/acylaminoacyl peptidase
VPVLLAQGLQDVRVPREHADDFAAAALKAGVKLQRLDYPNEGHGFQRASNKADFWEKLAVFLAASMKR